jgi:hypothetical protein
MGDSALQLDLFEQPDEKRVFQQPANARPKFLNRQAAKNAIFGKGKRPNTVPDATAPDFPGLRSRHQSEFRVPP